MDVDENEGGNVRTPTPSPSRRWLLSAYLLVTAAGVCLFFLIRARGERLVAPPPATSASSFVAAAPADTLLRLLVALVVVIVAARALGVLCRLVRQPPVMGEILAGLLLGPSLLGQVAPQLSVLLFPPSVTPLLGVLAQVGVLLYMFLVGLELDTRLLREKTHTTVAISHASILVPFLLGSGLALWLYPALSRSDVSFTAFALFMGISMSVTAFPVLARILTDRGLQHSRVGTVALTCAAVDDVTAWCLLAFVVGVIHGEVSGAGWTLGLTLLYIAAMFLLGRPLAARFAARYEGGRAPGQQAMAVVCIVLLLSSLATQIIGIHTLFGAFLLGAIIPHDSTLARTLRERLQDFVVVMLLPAFFALTGLRTRLDLIDPGLWPMCGAIILVACLGKFGGSALAARLTGMEWRDSAALGILMNTRGLMQLIVLSIGLDLQVISPTLFAMLVLMAMVTTFATTPVLDLLTRHARQKGEEVPQPCLPQPR